MGKVTHIILRSMIVVLFSIAFTNSSYAAWRSKLSPASQVLNEQLDAVAKILGKQDVQEVLEQNHVKRFVETLKRNMKAAENITIEEVNSEGGKVVNKKVILFGDYFRSEFAKDAESYVITQPPKSKWFGLEELELLEKKEEELNKQEKEKKVKIETEHGKMYGRFAKNRLNVNKYLNRTFE